MPLDIKVKQEILAGNDVALNQAQLQVVDCAPIIDPNSHDPISILRVIFKGTETLSQVLVMSRYT